MSNASSSKQRRVGLALSYAQTAASAVISVLYIPILLRGIGQSEYGLYQLLGSVIAYFSTMYSSLNASVMKYYTQYLIDNDTDSMENTLAISRRIFLIVSLIIVAISIPVIGIYRIAYRGSLTPHELNESMVMFVVMIANILIYLNNSIYSASILANEKFIFRRSLDLITQCIQPFAVVLFIKRYPYALTIVSIQLALNVCVAIANILYSKKQLHVKVVFHGKDSALVRGLLSLSGSILFVTLADQIFWKTDQLILGQLYGTGVVAVYSIGSQLNTIYISIGVAMSGVVLPMLTKIINNDEDGTRLSAVFVKLGRYQSLMIMLVFSGIALFGKEFIVILAGKDYLDAYVVAMLLMVPYTVDLIQNSGNTILQTKDKYWYRARVLFVAAIINIFLTYALAKKYGMYGAAAATTVAIIVTSWILMNYIYSKKIGLDIKKFWFNVAPIWFLGCIPFLIGLGIRKIKYSNNFIQFVIHVLLYVIFYILFAYFVIMKKEERKYLLGKFKKKN